MMLHSCGNTSLSLQKSEKRVATRVSSFKETVKMVDVAQNYAALVTTDGDLYSWGQNKC